MNAAASNLRPCRLQMSQCAIRSSLDSVRDARAQQAIRKHVEVVAKVTGVSIAEMRAFSDVHGIRQAAHLAMYLAYIEGDATMEEVGRFFGQTASHISYVVTRIRHALRVSKAMKLQSDWRQCLREFDRRSVGHG